MKTRHHYPILLIALLLGLMGFAERAQADYTLGHYTRVEADMNTIKLEWTKTTGSQGTMSLQFRYRVRWRESGSGRWKEYDPTTKLQCEIPDLKFGKTYVIEVISEAVYGTGGGSYGEREVSTIADKEEPKPQGYVDGYPKAISPTEIEVKWNLATDNITNQKDLEYSVHWTKSGSPWDVGGRYYVGGEETFLRITDLEPNTEYLVDVVVEDKARNQARYGKHTIKTPPAADTERPKPGGWVDGYPKATSPTTIEVKWNPAKDEGGTAQENLKYQVSCSILKKTMKECPVLTGQTEYTITDLPYSDVTYDISVKVWDEAGNYSFYTSKQVETPPATPPTITLSENEITLNADGGKKTITVTSDHRWNTKVDPESAFITNGGWLIFPSFNPKNVTVNPCEIEVSPNTGTEDRTAKIIFTSERDPSLTATLTVKQKGKVADTPKPTVQVSSILLNLPKVTIDGDRETFRLEATVLPADATNSELQWSSSNPGVATVETASMASLLKAGVTGKAVTVRIHKKGKAEITAQAMDGSGKSASCQVEVLSTVGNIEASEARIYAANGMLRISLPQPATIQIYNLVGRLVRSVSAPAGDTSVALPQGIYIVRTGAKIEKVVVQ